MQVLLITLGIASVTWAFAFGALLLLAPLAPFMAPFTPPQLGAFCSLFATLMAARSPASAIAVVRETAGKGPFCSLVMAVVVVKDVLVIVAFALNIEIARSVFSAAHAQVDLARILEPFVSVAVAATIGLAAAGVIPLALRGVSAVGGLRRADLRAVLRMVALAAMASATFALALYFEAEPLLACSVAGLVANNTMCAPQLRLREHMYVLSNSLALFCASRQRHPASW